jgi:ATP-binding cassette subfamily F protein 3
MISINNLTYHLGDRVLFDNASLHIKPKDKIGLIGLNGAGKTTLLRIINGEYKPDGGDLLKSNDCTIGYLNQDLLSYQSDESILEVAMGAFEEALRLEKKIEAILKKMETDYTDDLVHKLSDAQEKYEILGGYTLQSKAEEILEGIGFKTSDLHRPLREFSGGWRMRVMLAKLLLEGPSLLMLDEPTNHLDLPSIQWVEQYLKNYSGAVIVVSHDRRFLDNVVTSIVEVASRNLNSYSGNYSFYDEEKTLRNEIQKNAFENQQQQIKQTERFIERFRAKASKARQVQSKAKALNRLERIDEVVEERTDLNIRFTIKHKPGRHIVQLENVSKSYGSHTVLRNVNIAIERGDKIALVGANGLGKSTLLRIIAGTEPIDGKRVEGYNVKSTFYAQHQIEALNVHNEILDEMRQHGTDKLEQELRTVLGCFLFSNEDVYKKIKVLSGGEKSRVALAKVLISEANFLLLDEPTNHLDMQSVQILTQALRQYEGTFITVSHDRNFISDIANKIWFIEEGVVKAYPGTLDEYIYWQSQREEQQTKPSTPEKETKPPTTEKPKNTVPSAQSEKAKSLRAQLDKLEKEIVQLEDQKKQLEATMAKPEVYADSDQLLQHSTVFEEVNDTLDEKNQDWEKLALQIDELEHEEKAG